MSQGPFAYSNDGLSFRAVDPDYQAQSGEVIFSDYATPAQLTAAFPNYATAIAQQNAIASLTAALAAGITITSAGNAALNGTYAIDLASKTNIDGIYAGIRNGDGLPGGGATFNYADKTGAFHAFDATSFPNFAKAVRDYLYSISQGQPQPQPISIP